MPMRRVSGLDSWINGLPSSVRDAVVRCMRPRDVADGEAVYLAGGPGHECYLIHSGRIRITSYSRSGKEVQMMDFRDGACFGEISMIDGLPHPNNAFSSGDTELLVLEKRDFDRLYAEHHEIARQLNATLCHRLRTVSANAEDASILTLKERLPRLISRLATSHGIRDPSGVIVIAQISHNDLAHMLGVTRQSVSREIKGLERTGLVQLRYKKILVPDISAFAERFDSLIAGEPRGSGRID